MNFQLSNWFVTGMADHRILVEFFIDCKELLMSDLMIGLIKLALKVIIEC